MPQAPDFQSEFLRTFVQRGAFYDCSAAEDVYNEQYATYHLVKGGPVGVTSQVTLTRSTMIKY